MTRVGKQELRGQARLKDRVAIEVVTKLVPRHIEDDVVETTGLAEQRQRLLA